MTDAVIIQLIISLASIITTVILQRKTIEKESEKVQKKVEEQGTKVDEHGKKIDDMISKYVRTREFQLPSALDNLQSSPTAIKLFKEP